MGLLSISMMGQCYIMTVQDELSKLFIPVPLTEQSAQEVASGFTECHSHLWDMADYLIRLWNKVS
jgi:hypothetical protein